MRKKHREINSGIYFAKDHESINTIFMNEMKVDNEKISDEIDEK